MTKKKSNLALGCLYAFLGLCSLILFSLLFYYLILPLTPLLVGGGATWYIQKNVQDKRQRKDLTLLSIFMTFLLFIPWSIFMFSIYNNDVSETLTEQPEILGTEVSQTVEHEELETIAGTMPEKEYYDVVSITDGDTLKLLDLEKNTLTVRLVAVDAPELDSGECLSNESRAFLEELVTGKKVYLELDKTQGELDQYGRTLAYAFTQDDLPINERLISEGLAEVYTEKNSDRKNEYLDLQEKAKSDKKGLWGDACACTKGEERSRTCQSCNVATVTFNNWDCSTYEEKLTDNSCSNLCQTSAPAPSPQRSSNTAPTYTCNCSKACAQMSSCAEAYYQLNVCGCARRDGNNDGVPCENIC